MPRTKFIKNLGLSSLSLKDRWCISNHKKCLTDIILKKEKSGEPFILKEKVKFLAFEYSCLECRNSGNWKETFRAKKYFVLQMDNDAVNKLGDKSIKEFKKAVFIEKSGLSKRRKSNQESDIS